MNSLKTYLTEAYAIDNKSILRILTQNKQINKSDPDYNYYEKLANWANSSGKQQKLKNIDLNTIKLTDRGLLEKHKLTTRYTTLGHLLLALKNLMDQEGRYTQSSEISQLVQQTTLDILAALSGLNKKPSEEPDDIEEEPDDDNPTDDEELYEGMDWTAEKAKRLAEASTEKPASVILDKFYNDYYSIEYAGATNEKAGDPGIINKLKSLDKILIPEFNALGYNPEVNPLAQFLKILIALRAEDKADNIFDKLNTNNYGAIHNSFKDKYITGNMLGNYSLDNILFCKDLYNYRGLEIVNYLSLWKQIYDKADGDDTAKKLFAVKVLINQPAVKGDTYAEKINSLKNLAENTIKLPTSREAKLKSESEVRELYRHLFKTAAKKRVNIDKIVNEAKEQKVVLAMIRHILYQDDFRRVYPNDTKEQGARLKDIGYRYDEKENDTCEDILSEYELDAKDKRQILVKLVIAHNQSANNKKAGVNN
jgi:hypothetical protein